MTVSSRPDSFAVADYLDVLRRRWWIVFGVTCLGALLAAVYVVKAPKTYTATSSVYVSANAANANQLLGSRTAGVVNMDNEAQIVQSSTVAALAAKDLHSRLAPADLVKRLSVAVPANTTVLQISCSASSARGAAACSRAFAESYLASRQAAAQSKIKSATQALQARAAPLQKQSVALSSNVKSLPADSQALATAQANLANVNSQLATLRTDISSQGASINYNAGSIITAATPPTAPSSPRPDLYLASGLMAGLLIGLLAAFAVDRRDDRIHATRDVKRFLDLPVLFKPRQKKLALKSALASSASRTGRAFADLAQVVAGALGHEGQVVLVAGQTAGQGVSVVAANLAAALARTRSEVILCCGGLDNSVSPALLGVDPGHGRGLAELLAGTATVSEVAQRTAGIARLRVLQRGDSTAVATGQVQYDEIQRVVVELKRDTRYVVIEAETAVDVDGADTFSLAEFADTALLVLEVGSSLRSEAADRVVLLDRMRTAVVGAAVLPEIRRSSRDLKRFSEYRQEPRPAQGEQTQSHPEGQQLPIRPRL